jgi:hypothetical protein
MNIYAKGALLGLGVIAVGVVGHRFLGNQRPPKNQAAQSKKENPPRLIDYRITKWEVSYDDAVLGHVTGIAITDWKHKQVRITLKHPKTGANSYLTAEGIESPGNENDEFALDFPQNRIVLHLHGDSPSSDRILPPDLKGIQRIDIGQEDNFSVKPSEPAMVAPVKLKLRADQAKLDLELSAVNYGALFGNWSYHADPLTQRDHTGSGRVGYFRLLNKDELEEKDGGFLGLQSGREEWWPLLTSISHVVVMEDQLAYKGSFPAYPYPTPRQTTPETRRLFIVGQNLPIYRGNLLSTIQMQGPSVKGYRVLGVSAVDDPEHAKSFPEEWKRLLQELDEPSKKNALEQDAVEVEVKLADAPMLGWQEINWNGGHGNWFLQTGDNRAEAHFVRQIHEEKTGEPGSGHVSEQTDRLYLPEQIKVEIKTRLDLPLDQIPVRVARKSNLKQVQTFVAERVLGHTDLYQTKAISLQEAGRGALHQDAELSVAVDDQLQAIVQPQDVPFLAVPLAEATVFRTPGSTKPDVLGALWKDALVTAAACGNKPIGDLSTLSSQQAEKITSVIMFQQQERNIQVTLGNHAAMLLLRAAFVEMMKQEQDRIRNIEDDDQLEAFRQWIKPQVLGDNHEYFAESGEPPAKELSFWDNLELVENAVVEKIGIAQDILLAGATQALGVSKHVGKDSYLSRIKVTAPNGKVWPSWTAFDDDFLDNSVFHHDQQAARRWRLDAVKKAITEYDRVTKTARNKAEAIGNCDIQKLLKLTGSGFTPVVQELTPQLMKLAEVGTPVHLQWVPDFLARSEIANVRTLANAVRAQKDYASLDDQMIVMAVSVTAAVPAVLRQTAPVILADFLTQATIWSATSGNEIYANVKNRDEIEFAYGAMGVLGNERLYEAELQKTEWWKSVSSIVGQGVMLYFAAPLDLLSKEGYLVSTVGRKFAAYRGRASLAAVDKGNFTAFRAQTVQAQRDFVACLVEAKGRVTAGSLASREDLEVIALSNRLMDEASAAEAKRLPVTGIHSAPDLPPLEGGISAVTSVSEPFVPSRGLPLLDAPAPGSYWIAETNGAEEVAYELGPKLGNGAYSEVYVINGVQGRAALSITSGEAVSPKKAVIKIVCQNSNVHDTDTIPQRVLRMKKAGELLEEAGIEHARILEAHPNAPKPYVIQEIVEGGDVKMFASRDLRAPRGGVPSNFPVEFQEAIVKLFRKLADKEILGTDLSIPNLYFKKVGNEWIAGILDVDLLVRGDSAQEGYTWKWIKSIRAGEEPGLWSLSEESRPGVMANAQGYWEKMFEFMYGGNDGGQFGRAYITWDSQANTYRGVLIEPKLVAKYFPDFGKGLPPTAVPQ